ncbi:TNF receptor-associated factor [Echinococcus granulosus]|uniref:TNF receptor-associated factor n=1 Tax=Echinococcus granulosus TaxID=6210 RepID=W6U1S2_ECHGR|nr:TNF receptor-associated factor [Echinococcus granulosus]EUB55050.1 TNF receptor-associated factor [Echinococcus granulosus]
MSSSNHREEKAESESEKRTEVPSIADLTLRLAKEIAGGQQNNDSLNKSDSTQNAPSDLPIFYTPTPSDKYKCCACGEVLRRPVKFVVCEHSCCSTCYSDIMSSTGRCPIDGNVLERSEVTVDKQMQRELDHLGVKCNYFEQGCSWTGLAVELTDHLEECQCRLVRFMEQHVTADCPRRPVVCQFCQEKIEMYNQPTHMEMCKRFPIPCPNGCRRKELPREELTAHLEAGCPLQVINCPFSEQGCQFRGRKRQIRAHLADELVLHVLLLRDAVQGFHNLLDLQVQAVHESQAAVKKMQMKLQRCEAYFEPSFVWKIDGYREKFEEAQQGRKTSLFSNPFYSHRHGYRVCLSICPNGEQRYRGKYLSVFICICRGEYDALLSWPFSYPITLKLLDQNIDPGMRQDHVVTIRPNPIPSNNAYLKRPSSERNQCFGSPRFLELDQLHLRDFVVDNTLYIKAIFDINA